MQGVDLVVFQNFSLHIHKIDPPTQLHQLKGMTDFAVMAARMMSKLFKKSTRTPASSADHWATSSASVSPHARAIEIEESDTVSGHGGDVESSDMDQERQSKQPTNTKKKKKRLQRSKSDSHARATSIVPSESSGPDTEKESHKFRKRSKSATAKLGCTTAAAIKPFQKNVGSSEAENRLESDTTDKVSPASIVDFNCALIVICILLIPQSWHQNYYGSGVDRTAAELERILQIKDRQLAEKDERIAALEEKLDKVVKKFDELATIIKEN